MTAVDEKTSWIRRRPTRAVKVGPLQIGGGAPVSVQTMTKTDTRDIWATVDEIRRLHIAGADLVRLAVPDKEAARALKTIVKHSPLPVVADIHFHPILALMALEAGVHKLRLNPGNIGGEAKVREVVREAKARGVPIRIGVNAGSLEKDLLEKVGRVPEALVESARRHIQILEDMDFFDIVVSLKASDVPTMVRAYELMAEVSPYPLHLGVTEAGPGLPGVVKSVAGISHLLAQGIGDTIRVSLTEDAAREVEVGLEILYALKLRTKRLEIVACPTCGRVEIDLFKAVREAEEKLQGVQVPVKVAIMGCVVNGPGEAQEADVGVAGGNGYAVLFKKGRIVRRVREDEMVDALVEAVREIEAEAKKEGAG